ncbi:hypothetical protein DLM78_15675 [Leptospira stimsonii]|uniref:Uncharacterized protein n=1 Tax=Leptospira stimsonii TaxID=2202203 RepID=A0A8B3CPI6_9LEPT|nr:hypothetical protein DLM78_15675 [Leptospira stimsonii]
MKNPVSVPKRLRLVDLEHLLQNELIRILFQVTFVLFSFLRIYYHSEFSFLRFLKYRSVQSRKSVSRSNVSSLVFSNFCFAQLI